eukprot:jgi/Tetstr1/432677/TSEL_022045.t1
MEAGLAECIGAPWQTSPPGQKWASSLVVSRVRAAGIEEDEKDMRKRVTRGRPDAKVRKLMAASSTAQPPGVVKTLTDDKKRKRPVKKRRGKKLTVAESEAESVGGADGGGGGGGGSEIVEAEAVAPEIFSGRAATNKLRIAMDMFFAAFPDIATAKDVTPYMHEVAWHFPRWMEMHVNRDALMSAQCMEHCNREIKEGFRKGSNHQPKRLLKSGKVTLSRTGQFMTRSTLIAHHRDIHGPAHRAHPHLPKVKADAVKAEMAEKAANRRKI